jgi:hypothetical protein
MVQNVQADETRVKQSAQDLLHDIANRSWRSISPIDIIFPISRCVNDWEGEAPAEPEP